MDLKLHQALQRAQLLAGHKRFAEAERELRTLLAESPDAVLALYMLAEVLLEQEKLQEAEHIVHNILGLEPANAYTHYLHTRLLLAQEKNKEALQAINTAIALEPNQADYHGLHAMLLFNERQLQASLEAAEKGLSLDPEHLNCLNVRSRLLFKLNRRQEAVETIDKALEHDPENAITHANYGWAYLEKGEPRQALEHFRASLRIDPTLDYAREGMKEALKGRYWVYRQYLRYAFWIGSRSKNQQWMFLIGLYVAYRLLRGVAQENEALAPFVWPLVFLYILFAFSSWLLGPVGNLLLGLNAYGRYVLSENERKISTYIALSLGASLLGLLAWAVTGLDGLLALAVFGFSMMIPLGSMHNPPKAKDRKLLSYYTLGLLVAGALAVGYSLLTGELFNVFSVVYLLGFIVYQWLANAKVIR